MAARAPFRAVHKCPSELDYRDSPENDRGEVEPCRRNGLRHASWIYRISPHFFGRLGMPMQVVFIRSFMAGYNLRRWPEPL